MMLWRVVIQKPVPGKSEPKERELLRHRRVVVVEGSDTSLVDRKPRKIAFVDDRRGEIIKHVLADAALMAGTTGEIVSCEGLEGRSVVVAP